MGGKFLLRLNISERPIANKYREGKVKRTLKRKLKVREIVKRETFPGIIAWQKSVRGNLVVSGALSVRRVNISVRGRIRVERNVAYSFGCRCYSLSSFLLSLILRLAVEAKRQRLTRMFTCNPLYYLCYPSLCWVGKR